MSNRWLESLQYFGVQPTAHGELINHDFVNALNHYWNTSRPQVSTDNFERLKLFLETIYRHDHSIEFETDRSWWIPFDLVFRVTENNTGKEAFICFNFENEEEAFKVHRILPFEVTRMITSILMNLE